MKKHKLGLSITWYEFDKDSDEENANKVISYISKNDAKGESYDDDLSDEEIPISFRILVTKWEGACIELERQKKEIRLIHQDKEQLATIIACMKE